jgi:hypothetical protein
MQPFPDDIKVAPSEQCIQQDGEVEYRLGETWTTAAPDSAVYAAGGGATPSGAPASGPPGIWWCAPVKA